MSSYALNEDKMFADITDGIAIVINNESGIYYGMSSLGTAVFENLIKGVSTQKVLNALKALPSAPADIEAKLEAFTQDLLDKEILIKADETTEEVNISAEAAADFELTLTAYDDAQELLLADPIHEVKEETGWTPEKDSIGYTKEETKEREKKVEE